MALTSSDCFMVTGAVIAILLAPSFCAAPVTPMYPANFMKGLLRPSPLADGSAISVSMANLETDVASS